MVKGSDYLPILPTLIQRAIRAHKLQLSVQHSLEQIRYQALLLNNVRDAVVVWDIDGKITYWKPAAEASFGWKKSERVGPNPDEPEPKRVLSRKFLHKILRINWLDPILLTSLIIGGLVSIFQAATSISDATTTFVPKIMGVGLILAFLDSWMTQQFLSFTANILINLPNMPR